MKYRKIANIEVSAVGLGCMPMSVEGRPDEARSISTIHAALDEGVTLLDTADAYHVHADEVGHNEHLIAKAISQWSGDKSKLLVSTKGGHPRPGDGTWTVNGRPEFLKKCAKASLGRLGGDAIGLYHYHRPDPEVPYEDSVGAIRDLLDEGVIRLAAISNASVDQIAVARKILGGRLAAVQNQFSPAFRSSESELKYCDSIDVAFLSWSPLGTRHFANALGDRFAPFQEVADARGLTPQVVALAWNLAKSPYVIPIPGATRPESIRNSVEAVDVELTAGEMEKLDSA